VLLAVGIWCTRKRKVKDAVVLWPYGMRKSGGLLKEVACSFGSGANQKSRQPKQPL
jgi:hypothetical protein